MKKYRKLSKIKRKKSILKSRFFWFFIFSLLIFLAGFYFVCFSSFFEVKEIKVSGNQKIAAKEIEDLVWAQTERKIIFFESKSIFLTSLKNAQNEILIKFPLISQVVFKRQLPNIILTEVEERKAVGLFNQFDKNFLIAKDGIIFEEINQEMGEYLKIKNLTLNNYLSLGQKAIETDVLNFILLVDSKLENELKIPLKEASIVSSERLNVVTLEGWEIYFNLKGDAKWQITKIKADLQDYIPPERVKDLEYIDVRFEDLAPFKYR